MRPLRQFQDHLSYELLRPIAQGGMGCVYEALQDGTGGFRKRVALKLIRQEYSSQPLFRRNFVGEARLVADLIHANIVQTYHLGKIREQYFMVMEYVNGVNLEQFLLQHRALGQTVPGDLAAFIVSRLSRALAYAHQQCDAYGNPLGIVHRDVSPRNIMLAYSGDVKLTDFGIAKAFNLMYSEEGEIIAGRSDYLSPEQARLEITDARADIFSCGVLLAEMLLGHNPFLGSSPESSRANFCSMSLPDFASVLPPQGMDLIPVLKRALQRDRGSRYQDAESLMTDLEKLLYRDGYGPTNEKLGLYMKNLYRDGPAYKEDLRDLPASVGLSSEST